MAKNIDKSNLKQIILDFPKQFVRGIEIAKNTKVKGKFDRVIICGMGGSALAGDILAKWLESSPSLARPGIPAPSFIIDRTYQLPSETDKRSLIFISSYSGDTEEKITEYKEARKKRLTIVCFCSGGKLEAFCRKDKIPLVTLPKGFPPRYTLGLEFSAMVTVLSNSGLIKKYLSRSCADLPYTLSADADLERRGKRLAKRLIGKIPLIYASDRYKALAYNWKIKFNENSKIMAFYNVFPELNHNELAGHFGVNLRCYPRKSASTFHVIILRSSDDHPRIKKRMNLTAKMIKEKGGEVTIINLQGKNFLEKIFSGILLADWTSFWLALEYGIDPMPIKVIEKFKETLKH